MITYSVGVDEVADLEAPLDFEELVIWAMSGTEVYNGAVAFLQLEPSFRPRFSKYPKPKRGIGPDSLKTGAKQWYRPRSSKTRSQKLTERFEFCEPFFFPATAPPFRISLSLALSLSPKCNGDEGTNAIEEVVVFCPFVMITYSVGVDEVADLEAPLDFEELVIWAMSGTEVYNGAVAFLQLEPSFRPRFSKYPKPKRGIGPDSLKTGAKQWYRPRSSKTRSQKLTERFEFCEPFFFPATAPPFRISLSLALSLSPKCNGDEGTNAIEEVSESNNERRSHGEGTCASQESGEQAPRLLPLGFVFGTVKHELEVCVQVQGLSIKCARVGDMEIPNNKRIEYSLQYIHGVGRSRARHVLERMEMVEQRKEDEDEGVKRENKITHRINWVHSLLLILARRHVHVTWRGVTVAIAFGAHDKLVPRSNPRNGRLCFSDSVVKSCCEKCGDGPPIFGARFGGGSLIGSGCFSAPSLLPVLFCSSCNIITANITYIAPFW
ncbi:small subunit ribosomal protein S13 [Vigna unguiculata]|uniref:Small subunit ribosomal protein S13 n=1 Tax=Vigna unguiculata TaxID=3917 RepID=A0A4D6NK09_VIGUN|nr:small subunit ribosomal protein S13 [Vigna unguiculata]